MVTTITALLVATCIYAKYEGFSTEVTYVRSKVDNRRYLVRNIEGKEESADHLAELRARLKNFVKDIKKTFPNDPKVQRLSSKFKPDNLSETTLGSKFTSYSVNKGEKIVFCIRQRDTNNNLIDINTITFVALHELAHVMTISIGHTSEFWDNFKFLLKHAINKKFYKYQPFHLEPHKYCGTTIGDTPLKL